MSGGDTMWHEPGEEWCGIPKDGMICTSSRFEKVYIDNQNALFLRLTLKSPKKKKKGPAGVITLVLYMYLQVGVYNFRFCKKKCALKLLLE